MQKLTLAAVAALALIAACSAPTPTATQTPVSTATAELPTVTAAFTLTPTAAPPTHTPEPTATATATSTATPAAQPIGAANLAGLSRTGVIALPRKPSLVTDPALSGIIGGYTPDSQHILLRTDAGVDVISAATLDLEQHYPALRLLNVLSDGRFAALQGDALVFVDPLSGKVETVTTEANLANLFAVNPSGQQLASLVDPKTVRLYSLTGAEPVDIKLPQGQVPKLRFSPAGAYLVLDFIPYNSNHIDIYDAATAKLLFSHPAFQGPNWSADDKYFVEYTFGNGYTVDDSLTGDVVNQIQNGASLEDFCDATKCTLHYIAVQGYFVGGGPESVLTFPREFFQTRPLDNFNWDMKITDIPAQLTNFLTGAQVASLPNYSKLNVVAGFGAADGSAFALVKNTGEIFVHNPANGDLLTQTDRYAIGGPARLSPDGAQVGWANAEGVYVYDWSAAQSILAQTQPLPVSYGALVGFLPDARLLVESVPGGGSGLDLWDIAAGQMITTVTSLANCQADTVGLYVLCTVPSSGSRRIIALDKPERIVFAANGPNITALSLTGDSYATCTPSAASITYKNYASGNVTLKQPCQPMLYRPDGQALILQSGVVVDLPSGESTLTLETDASGLAFSAAAPAAFFGPGFILIDNRAFDAASGALLTELPLSGATGFMLSADGLTLYALTPNGLEQWQVQQ